MDRLAFLNLNSNKIRLLDPYINKLKRLQAFYMERNMLPSLPTEFCELTMLTELSFANNNLQILPHEFGRLVDILKSQLYIVILYSKLNGNLTFENFC